MVCIELQGGSGNIDVEAFKNCCWAWSTEPHYTNDVESLNKVVKQQVKYKAEELPRFAMLMKQMVVSQKKEIQKAVINMGKYRITESHQHLCVDKQKFFSNE